MQSLLLNPITVNSINNNNCFTKIADSFRFCFRPKCFNSRTTRTIIILCSLDFPFYFHWIYFIGIVICGKSAISKCARERQFLVIHSFFSAFRTFFLLLLLYILPVQIGYVYNLTTDYVGLNFFYHCVSSFTFLSVKRSTKPAWKTRNFFPLSCNIRIWTTNKVCILYSMLSVGYAICVSIMYHMWCVCICAPFCSLIFYLFLSVNIFFPNTARRICYNIYCIICL